MSMTGRIYERIEEWLREELPDEADEEIQRLIKGAYADAKTILTEHVDKLHFVAQYLLGHETMDADQFAAAMKDGATEEELDAIAAEKAEKSRRDNEERLAKQKAEEETKAAEEAKAVEEQPSSEEQEL